MSVGLPTDLAILKMKSAPAADQALSIAASG